MNKTQPTSSDPAAIPELDLFPPLPDYLRDKNPEAFDRYAEAIREWWGTILLVLNRIDTDK